MVEFKLKINPKQSLAYIPREISKVLGREVEAVANRVAVLMYPKDMDTLDVLKSLEIIQMDLQHKIELEKRRRIEK